MNDELKSQLDALNLTWIRDNLDEEVATRIRQSRPHHEIVARLGDGELAALRAHGGSAETLNRYLHPDLLVRDELGYLPSDKLGAELLFQVFVGRYEEASTVITTNRPYKERNKTCANDNAMTAAVLDRVQPPRRNHRQRRPQLPHPRPP